MIPVTHVHTWLCVVNSQQSLTEVIVLASATVMYIQLQAAVVPDNKAVMLEFAGASLEYTADDLIDKQKQVAMLLSQRVRGQVWFR